MSSFWSCGTCETTNPTDVAICDVCGAGRAAPLRVLPLRLADAIAPIAAARPWPAARPTPVRVDRRTTATPPTWKVQQAKIRRRVMRVLTSIRRAVREFLRA